MEKDDLIVLQAKKKILSVCRSVYLSACLSVETVSFEKVDGLKPNLVGVFNVYSIVLISKRYLYLFVNIHLETYFENLQKNGNSLVWAMWR